jgi:CRISPR-associated protein Cas2
MASEKIDILVSYDVETETKEGARRLRKVATICKNYGQRVQKSVFECRVTRAQLESLEHHIKEIMDPQKDSLRIYLLHLGRKDSVRTYGIDKYRDFDEPLVI